MLGVLQIVFSEHRVADGMSITRERNILFSNVSRCAADFYIGPVALEAPREWVLTLAVAIVVGAALALMMAIAAAARIVAAAASAVLLSLPHGLHSRSLRFRLVRLASAKSDAGPGSSCR